MDNSLETLAKSSFFSEFSDAEFEVVQRSLEFRSFIRGETIISVDDELPAGVYFLIQGEVKVNLVGSDGKEIVLALLGPGEFFGELSLLRGEAPTANVIANEITDLYFLPKFDFFKLLESSSFSLALLKSLASRLGTATSKIGDLALCDVFRRVARTLKSLAKDQVDEQGQSVSLIQSRPTHSELAAMAGTSREMVTRALKGLEEDGCIKVEGKRIEFIRLPR